MHNNTGFFHWIRDAVRRSVLLGLSDAVEQIGTAESGEIHPQLVAMLRPGTQALENKPMPAPAPSKPERKRLGRSLEQLRESATKPAGSPS